MERKYELKRRAEAMAETRRRIAVATAQLHEEVGPARTTVSEIARRAGVGRLTVYNHFPDEADLFAACQQHFLAEHPPPDLLALATTAEDPDARTLAVLEALYAYYRETRGMVGNVERDAPTIPALSELVARGRGALLGSVADALMRGRRLRGRRAARVRAALALALSFQTWDTLAGRGGLADRDAACVAAGAVRCASAQV